MVGDRQHLNLSTDFAIYKVKVENLEHAAPNVGGKDNARSGRRITDHGQNILQFSVVAPSQSCLNFFLVGDLLFVLFGGLGMEPIFHLKSA